MRPPFLDQINPKKIRSLIKKKKKINFLFKKKKRIIPVYFHLDLFHCIYKYHLFIYKETNIPLLFRQAFLVHL
jgi:hypothetical protein